MKKMAIEERIIQRNSRPSLRLQLCPQTNGSDHVYGNSVSTPPSFSPRSQPRLGRSLHSPLTPCSSTGSSGSCGCLSPYDSNPRSERLLRSPLTPQSTNSGSGCSCCSSPCYVPSPRSQLSPFTMHSQGNYPGCFCCVFPVHEQTPGCCQGPPQSQPLSPYTSYSVPSSPYNPMEVPSTAFSPNLALLCNQSNIAPYVKAAICTCSACYTQSPYKQQIQGGKSRCYSLPSSPRPPRGDQLQLPRMARSMPCSPNTTSTSLSKGVFMPHQPLLRRRQHMKNESLLRKSEEELLALRSEAEDNDNDGKPGVEFFP